MNRERPRWYQGGDEEPAESAEQAESEQPEQPEQSGESTTRDETPEPTWRRRDQYEPFEAHRRRMSRAETEAAAERAEAERLAAQNPPATSNPFADQPLAGPWGDGTGQETIAGDYPVIANDPDDEEDDKADEENVADRRNNGG